ncbi:uncharacterized protein LOC125238950 [Leguminivora glycinivorella]|uniref:uncharacterized protein LOC125238950 n=1 Tax=Leguminivora glycinivorella TaxID=1035111 RepID=UPI00200CD700|nr:uncharacterized protein LOC125238950 [Leguminivora glycinivorella]
MYTYQDITVTGQDAADAFASYFCSVFQTEEPQLDPVKAAHKSKNDAMCVSIDSVGASELHKASRKLKPRSSVGPDAVPPFLAKDCISALEVPLLHIYNLSLQTATYPACWKRSRVTPVPKSGSGSDVTGYRPIAVLPVFGKLFETILDSEITRQISTQLDDDQHGFRKGLRPSLALYYAYVRSRLEYGAMVWDPHEAKYTLMLERVQRKFASANY